MKVVIGTDVHAHKYRAFNQDNRRLTNIVAAIEEMWDKAAELKGILCLVGDIFNTHQVLHVEAMDAVFKLFKRKIQEHKDTDVIFISGNHDQSTKNTVENPAISSVHSLAKLSDNVHCIDDGYYTRDDFEFTGVPYYPDPAQFKLALADLKEREVKSIKRKYLLMHQTVVLDIALVPDDINPKDKLLEGYDYIFNGHIHDHSEVTDRFINVGTPLHRDMGDVGKDKGYLILDTETNTWERVLTNYPQFRKLEDGEEVPEEWKDDYVVWIPKQIAVTVEEEEIREKFDHNRVSREELLQNFLAIKLGDADPIFSEAVRNYHKKLIEHA